eukprot:Nitzschia sp. Nitz4//scaffold265_size26576//1775//2275//NITZ4_008243-RA/size26576-processed-gene-0.9-mRNA-1//1//CDS//3329544825//3327//frame0
MLHDPRYLLEGFDDDDGIAEEDKFPFFKVLGIVVAVLVGMYLCMVCFQRQLRLNAKYRSDMQANSVFSYLQDFDVEDIDLRKSPLGGWNATYLSRLAFGIHKRWQGGDMEVGEEELEETMEWQQDKDESNTAFAEPPLSAFEIGSSPLMGDDTTTPRLGTEHHGLT